MLAHPPCASISHWLGSFQIFGYFLAFFEKLPNQCEMLAQGVCASISHWLGKTGSFRNYTLIGQDFKTAQSMWKISKISPQFQNCPINVWKLPNQCEMLAASISHWLGYIHQISKISLQFQNCPINVWKLPNQCEMLAASISHWLGCIHQNSKISPLFQNCPINVRKLPNQCEMLAASISHWLGCIFKKFIANFKTA